MSRYNPQEIEPRWQARWAEERPFAAAPPDDRPKFYALCMFPYPSGSGLHLGHPLSYTAVDIVARYKRLRGFNVLNPIGWDAFGLPAERDAVRKGRHPADITSENVGRFKEQLQRLGFSFDWEREVNTSHKDYYRWSQWIFLKLHERGLAYRAEVPVWWCPAQGTVLANEEVVDGVYVDTGEPVERRSMRQWMLKITAYAQRLLDDLDDLDWPEHVKEMQRNWIGRSEGAEVRFEVADPGQHDSGQHDSGQPNSEQGFTVFTTRPDTLFGATWCVLAPEHPLVESVTTDEQRAAVAAYVERAGRRSDRERQQAAERDKTGVFTGAYATNPLTGQPIPIWISDYVLMSYGTGAIMAVPAHDERDHAFARAFALPIVQVISAPEDHDIQAAAWTGDGTALNSGDYDGMDVASFKAAVTADLEARGIGTRKVNFKLRDWLFSRQRYWGEPFPVVITDDGEVHPVDEAELPIELPHLDAFKPTADGQPPLARAEDWVATTWNGQPARRETNTMPQWAGSCWYYLRYMDPHNHGAAWSAEAEQYWGPVDLYIGGLEHAVLHLLYSRFWHKVLYDCGLVSTKEPFQRLFNQGMLLAPSFRDVRGRYHAADTVTEGEESHTLAPPWSRDPITTTWASAGSGEPVARQIEKMGKSKMNSVDPLDVVARYGADTLRTWEMFMGPLDQAKIWDNGGCEGVYRFLSRVWRLLIDEDTGQARPAGATAPAARRALHLAIKDTTEALEDLRFNTPISKMMSFVNACGGKTPSREDAAALVTILSPWAPHLCEELWSRLGHAGLVCQTTWPTWDPSALVEQTTVFAVQVRGKVRGRVTVPRGADRQAVLAAARQVPNVARHLEGKTVIKEIFVPGRLVNFVVR